MDRLRQLCGVEGGTKTEVEVVVTMGIKEGVAIYPKPVGERMRAAVFTAANFDPLIQEYADRINVIWDEQPLDAQNRFRVHPALLEMFELQLRKPEQEASKNAPAEPQKPNDAKAAEDDPAGKNAYIYANPDHLILMPKKSFITFLAGYRGIADRELLRKIGVQLTPNAVVGGV